MAASREGTVKSIRFEGAKGGMVSHMEKAYKRGGQGGGPLEDHEYTATIHPTMEHAKAHLEKHMAHCYGDGEPKGEAKSEGEEY